jgi:prolyl-tRNA synthetase
MEKKDNDLGITVKKSENFSEWYQQVIIKSGFIDYTEVSGCIVFRPAAYGAWEAIKEAVDKEFKKDGVENVYFPLFIPEKFLMKEKEHVEGFSAEVAWVTEAGSSKLGERLAVRPTSETIMYPSYSKWIRSWRDLPLRYNQWNNVVRWEFKHPTPFIRSREFLWNEGHTVFATAKEAEDERDVILGIYMKVLKEYLALPGIVGKKTDNEKFAGAIASFSVEHIMPDGWALQGPDFHLDGQNFSKAFDIKFLTEEGTTEYAFQNTYAISTRELGVLVATHGDDKGLILPPNVAYIQVVIVPIFRKENKEKVLDYAKKVNSSINEKLRTKLDSRDSYSPGYKFSEWELKGIPLRIEIGEKEADSNLVTIVRRDTGEKTQAELLKLKEKCTELLKEITANLYAKAEKFLKSHIHSAEDYSEFKKVLEEKKGIIHAAWCGGSECEAKVKDETGAKITNIPFEHEKQKEKCVHCGKKAKHMANFARSY